MMLRYCIFAFAAGVLVLHSSLLAQQGSAPKTAAKHDHSAHGPHHGDLIEIGNDEYHAEVVIDEVKKQLVLYLFDAHVKSYVAIDAPSLAVNLKMAGKPVQLKLKPIPQDIDKFGFASRFGIESPELLDALHAGHADAKIALKIGKKAYSIKLEHDHDHAHSHK